jgi:NADPH-dependent glutamate synthase beta subunit-like oxidoreductase
MEGRTHKPVFNETLCGSCGVCRGACPATVAFDLAAESDTLRGVLAAQVKAKSELPPCREACPLGQDIPGYLACLAGGDQNGALEVILRDNPLPSVLGHVCHHPCQEACLKPAVGQQPMVRELKRFAALAPRPQVAKLKTPAKGKVAIIGSGPAGLAAAWSLAKVGIKPVIFEAEAKAGGMLAWAIPDFRLPQAALLTDLEYVQAHGVEIRLNSAVDFAALDKLRADYDAVILACGAPLAKLSGLPGENLKGVWLGLDFLKACALGRPPQLKSPVIVVGGGNVAVDAARSALRMDAKVRLVYRRDREAMPAYAEEVEAASAEGLDMHFLRKPLAIEAGPDGAAVAGFKISATKLEGLDQDGRPAFKDLMGSEEIMEAGSVILALGQNTQAGDWARALGLKSISPDEKGCLAPKLYAAGDLVTGPATVVDAMAAGISCARAIMEELAS